MFGKHLANLTKERREKAQNLKIRGEEGAITININEIQRIMSKNFENLCSNKLENLEGTDIFLDVFDLLKLNQKDINHLNRIITSNDIEAVIVSQQRKSKT
jgi:hypothetical protein